MKKINNGGSMVVRVAAVVVITQSVACAVRVVADGWQSGATVPALSWSEPATGVIEMVFPGTGFPDGGSCAALPLRGGNDAAFLGNYSAAGVSAVSFTITSSGGALGRATRLVLRGPRREWCNYNMAVGGQPGEPAGNRLSFALDDGWVTADPAVTPETVAAAWREDLRGVTYLAVVISRKVSRSDQTVTLADFALEGGFGAMTLDAALLAALGVSTVELAQTLPEAACDKDRDGLTDLQEMGPLQFTDTEAGQIAGAFYRVVQQP
jgi:hypothetical protein